MDDLVVDDELTTAIVDDQSTDAATAVGEGTLDLAEQATVVNDGEALLDVTRLGHTDEETI